MVFSELGNSLGSFSYITPSSDLDIDDATLGKLLTEAHREHADYRNPEGVSVSQSSLSVVFDRTEKPVGERNVDQSIGFGVTRNTYSAHSKFSENTQAEKVVDRTGKPVGENSSNAQIRTLLDEQRQMIIAEHCEKIGHHELQAARAEGERRILQEELCRQQMDFREVHQQSLTEMEELRKFQSSTFDTLARRKLIEDQKTIMELSGRVQELQNEVNIGKFGGTSGFGNHSVYTHFPKDRNCEICERTKITRAPCRRRNGEAVPRAVNFGDLITADHKVLSDNCESRNNHRYAVVVQDLATQWIQAYPCKNKTSQETQRSLQKFLEPERNPKVIYTDNSLEFGKACEDLSWNHCTSTPHRSETNGIAERAVRRVKDGTSAVLLQSGLNESWWADSMECYTYLRNVTDLLSDGKTPYERRFGQPFKGPLISFGSLVEYHPITAKDQSRIHQFGKKVLPGLFLGYALYAGGIWKGDVLIADLGELETMDASEIYSKRLNAKEVKFPRENGKFMFPVADRRIKFAGGDQELRTSTLIRQRPIQGESHLDFLGESVGLCHHLTTHFRMPVKQ